MWFGLLRIVSYGSTFNGSAIWDRSTYMEIRNEEMDRHEHKNELLRAKGQVTSGDSEIYSEPTSRESRIGMSRSVVVDRHI